MNLVNMKHAGEETCAPCPPEAYPYGLRLCLTNAQCKMLGILGPVSPGAVVQITALATVVYCAERKEVEEDDTHVSLDLQITDMGLDAPGANLAPMLWPK